MSIRGTGLEFELIIEDEAHLLQAAEARLDPLKVIELRAAGNWTIERILLELALASLTEDTGVAAVDYATYPLDFAEPDNQASFS